MAGVGNMLEYIAQRDHRVMHRVNNWRAPRWVRVWMMSATRGGDGWLWYGMAILVLLFGGGERFQAVIATGLASGAGTVIFLWLKKATRRKRPCHIAEHCWARLLPPDQFSFPSGHSINAFAVAIALGSFYPALLLGLLFCAFSVAVSRVLLGMHFLSDVLVGSSIGGLLGYSAFLLYR